MPIANACLKCDCHLIFIAVFGSSYSCPVCYDVSNNGLAYYRLMVPIAKPLGFFMLRCIFTYLHLFNLIIEPRVLFVLKVNMSLVYSTHLVERSRVLSKECCLCVCVCVCVCVYVFCKRLCVCVCVCAVGQVTWDFRNNSNNKKQKQHND